MFRTAVRRKSCGMRPGQPASMHAFFHALLSERIRRGCFAPRSSATMRVNTWEQISLARLNLVCSAFSSTTVKAVAPEFDHVRRRRRACPVVATGERRNGKGVIAQGIGPLDPNQHDTTRSGKTIAECQLAEVSVACNGYSLLDLSSRQNGMICFSSLIFLDPPNIMPQLAQAADDGPGDVLVGEKTHRQPKGPRRLEGRESLNMSQVSDRPSRRLAPRMRRKKTLP